MNYFITKTFMPTVNFLKRFFPLFLVVALFLTFAQTSLATVEVEFEDGDAPINNVVLEETAEDAGDDVVGGVSMNIDAGAGGSSSSGGGSSKTAQAVTADIILEPGWNIVSTPKVLVSHEFSAAETVDNFDIYLLDASSQTGWSNMADLGQSEFTPLYGYFVNNKTGVDQTLTFEYKTDLGPLEHFFTRTFLTTGWYSIGVANDEFAKDQTANLTDTNNPSSVLSLLAGDHDLVVDFTDAQYESDRMSVALHNPFKSVLPANLNDLNDLRETKGYAIYIKEDNAEYNGLQNAAVVVEPTEVELSIESSSDNPDSTILLVEDDSDESDEYVVHVFDVEVGEDSSDFVLNEGFVDVTIGNRAGNADTTVGNVVADVYLTIDGIKTAGVATDILGSNDGDADVTGDGEVDHVIAAGETNTVRYYFEFAALGLVSDTVYESEVSVVFEGQDGNYEDGVTISTNVDGALWTAEGLDDNHNLTGSDASETHSLADVVPVITDTDFYVDQNEYGDAGTISYEFTIEADGNDIVLNFGDIDDLDGTTDDVRFSITTGGGTADYTAAITLVSGDVTSVGSTGWTIGDGNEATFVIDFTFTSASTAGSYRVNIDTIAGIEIDETSSPLNLID